MKKIALAAAAVATFAGAASAADLPVKAPPLAAAPPCVWCGFYVGVNAGYAWSESTSVNSISTVTSVPATIARLLPWLLRLPSRLRSL
jgi:opacity protein-like surface antigen